MAIPLIFRKKKMYASKKMQTRRNSSADWERLLRFDSIRASKLLEIGQYAVLALTIGFIFGSLIDKIFPECDEKHSNGRLILEVFIQTVAIAVLTYYTRKLVMLVPFQFALTDKYVPSAKEEAWLGVNMALPIVFVANQKQFLKKLQLLRDRIF